MAAAGSHSPEKQLALTQKQRDVLALMARGRTNFEIAQELGLSLEGAKYHVSEILGRLGVDSREEAVALWKQRHRPAARLGRMFAPLAGAGWLALGSAGVLAVAAVGIGVGVFVAAANGGDGEASEPGLPQSATPADEDPAEESTPEVTATPVSAAPTPACALGTPTQGSVIDWVRFVRLRGHTYLDTRMGPLAEIAGSSAGAQVGEVLWRMTDDSTHPCHASLDGAAGSLPVGTKLYEMHGYSADFRILAKADGIWRIYESDWRGGARTASELLDIRGWVVSITIEERSGFSDQSKATWRVDDPSLVDALVTRLLDQPLAFTSAVDDGPTLLVTFALRDETWVSRSWFAGEQPYSAGIPVDAAFIEETIDWLNSNVP